ncbi:GMC family oxidoreductase [uncultured Kordia sp.]|uniref:GMC oxidoreductase n=1 Tax=uncultured Kordia sp. TaxID=507699 RepID=UPI00261D1E88|nr:GMC family oxidoreductase [uncultured Kordia sp.]
MNVETYAPKNPEKEYWDVIVIGTGMGGATMGYELSQLGKRVLFVEKGKHVQAVHFVNGEIPAGIDETQARLIKGRWPHKLEGETSFGKTNFFGPVGCGTGGSTILYGAQLERFQPADFTPKKYFKNIGDSTIPDKWPINYNDFIPYYRKAEAHMKICGTQDRLNPDAEAPLLKAPALSERDEFIFSSMQNAGLHPYRSHVGYHNSDKCWECLDLCFRGCKSDAGTRSLLPALFEYNAKILTECEVVRLEADAKSVQNIHAIKDGKTLKLQAKIVVLAAGAYATPSILLSSTSDDWKHGLANGSGMVGRNLMLHTSDFIMVNQKKKRDATGPIKSITMNDFYIHNGEKLGTFQSVGLKAIPPIILSYLRYVEEKDPSWFRRKTSFLLPKISKIASKYFHKSAAFSTIVEDLPYLHNRVELDPNTANGFRIHYTYSKELKQRTKKLRKLIAKSLSPNLKTTVVTGTKNNINFGHVCGTCRFGNDPKTSVLNADNRAHEVDNLYIVDASFFPSSSGTNPSLTIAANAIRVSEIINKQLDKKQYELHHDRSKDTQRI